MFSMSFFAHRMAHLCLLASVLCCAPSARAVEQLSGFVDQSLDGQGWFFGNFRGPNERLSASAENDAGMMVSVGTFGTTDTRCEIVRHKNSTFTGGPELVLDAVTSESCSKVIALASGEFRVIGSGIDASTGLFTGFIVALNADGTVNDSVHPQGLELINPLIPWRLSTERTTVYAGALDAQGRLLVLGRISNSANNTIRGLLLRFLPGGTLDTSFGVEGSYPLADFNPPLVAPSSVTTASDGKIFVAGFTSNQGFPDVGIIFRLLEDGQPDLSFGAGMNAIGRNGGGGRGFFERCYRVRDLQLDSAERMILGCAPDPSGAIPGPILQPGVLRLLANGQPDLSFSGDGFVELLPAGSSVGVINDAPRIALRTNGQIVAGATVFRASTHPDPQDIVVTRLNANGSTDGGFGFNGLHQSNFRTSPSNPPQESDGLADTLLDLRLDARERVVLTGSVTRTMETYGLVARLGMADPEQHAGFFDPDYTTQGYRTEYISVSGLASRRGTFATDLALDASGRALLLGNIGLATTPTSGVCGIARYNGGQPDTSFSGGGRRTISLVPGGSTACNALAARADNTVLVAGAYALPNTRITGALVKLFENGLLDTSFQGDGVLDTWNDLGFSTKQISALFRDIVIDADGRTVLLAQGFAIGSQDNAFRCGFGAIDDACGVLIRLLPDGSLDTSFSEDGMRLLISSTNPSRLFVESMTIDQNGRILVAGSEGSINADYSGVLFDVPADGAPNSYLRLRSSASCLGTSTVSVDIENARWLDCFIQGTNRQSILRLLPNNNVDLNFGVGGLRQVEFGFGSAASIRNIQPQPDGSMIVIGTHTNFADWISTFGSQDIGVRKFDRSGTSVFTFGAREPLRLPNRVGYWSETPVASVMQADGRLLIAGTIEDVTPPTPSNDRTEMLLIRLGNPQPVPLPDPVFADGFE
jgi:uncharacterized delta-60 repeat protein